MNNGIYEHGYVQLNPDLNDLYDVESGEEIYVPSNYPFSIPNVYLDGSSETCSPEIFASKYVESLVVVNDMFLTKYINNVYYELLTIDQNGNEIWVDSRTIPLEDYAEDGLYKDARSAEEFKIERIELNSLEKKTFKVTPESTSQMDLDDFSKFVNYIDPNIIKRINIKKDSAPNE